MELGPWNKVDIIEISPFNELVLLHVKINRNMVIILLGKTRKYLISASLTT